MLSVVKYILPQTVSVMELFENIHHLAELCAHSKKKNGSRYFTGCLSLSKRIRGLALARVGAEPRNVRFPARNAGNTHKLRLMRKRVIKKIVKIERNSQKINVTA
jgi:hypothetical protein